MYQQVTLAGCRYCSYSTSVWWKVSQIELGREGVDVKVVGPVSFFSIRGSQESRVHVGQTTYTREYGGSKGVLFSIYEYMSNTVYMSK